MEGVCGGILAEFCNSSTKLQEQKVSRNMTSLCFVKKNIYIYFRTGSNGWKERRNAFAFVYES